MAMEYTPTQDVIDDCVSVGHCFAAVGLYAGTPPEPVPAVASLLAELGANATAPTSLITLGSDEDFNRLVGAWR